MKELVEKLSRKYNKTKVFTKFIIRIAIKEDYRLEKIEGLADSVYESKAQKEGAI